MMAMQNPKILFDNRFKDAVPVASSTAAGNVLNVRDWRPYTWWKPASLPASIIVDCGSAKDADYALVWGHDLATHGATLEVRGSDDNFDASDELVASHTPDDNKPFLLQFASVSYRYWCVTVDGDAAPSMAIVSVGKALQMPSQVQWGFDPLERNVVGQTNKSEAGHPLGKALDFESWRQSVTFEVMQSWVRNTFEPAWKTHLRSTPFVYAWEPGEHADELYLVTAGDKLSTPHHLPLRARLSFDMSGVALP